MRPTPLKYKLLAILIGPAFWVGDIVAIVCLRVLKFNQKEAEEIGDDVRDLVLLGSVLLAIFIVIQIGGLFFR